MSGKIDAAMRKLVGLEAHRHYKPEVHEKEVGKKPDGTPQARQNTTLHVAGSREAYQSLKRGQKITFTLNMGQSIQKQTILKKVRLSRYDTLACPDRGGRTAEIMFVVVCLTDCVHNGQCLKLLKKLGQLEVVEKGVA